MIKQLSFRCEAELVDKMNAAAEKLAIPRMEYMRMVMEAAVEESSVAAPSPKASKKTNKKRTGKKKRTSKKKVSRKKKSKKKISKKLGTRKKRKKSKRKKKTTKKTQSKTIPRVIPSAASKLKKSRGKKKRVGRPKKPGRRVGRTSTTPPLVPQPPPKPKVPSAEVMVRRATEAKEAAIALVPGLLSLYPDPEYMQEVLDTVMPFKNANYTSRARLVAEWKEIGHDIVLQAAAQWEAAGRPTARAGDEITIRAGIIEAEKRIRTQRRK